jgi:sulfite reductase alpha subunit-like flavoprotein
VTEARIIEYSVESSHYSTTIRHELLFSIAKRHFIKPAYSRKSEGRLYYRLLPGNYLKFELFVSIRQNYAHFSIVLLHLDSNGNIESKEVFSIKMTYSTIFDILSDINAPYALVEFLRMMPRYHSVANVDVDERYEYSEDAQQMVESIKKYLERRTMSQ